MNTPEKMEAELRDDAAGREMLELLLSMAAHERRIRPESLWLRQSREVLLSHAARRGRFLDNVLR